MNQKMMYSAFEVLEYDVLSHESEDDVLCL
jgi:hypothetical protein